MGAGQSGKRDSIASSNPQSEGAAGSGSEEEELGSDEIIEDLLMASKEGDVDEIRRLVTPQNVNSKDADGWTPLHYAAISGYLDVVQLLASHGAHISLPNKHGDTALHWAAYNGHVEMVRFLVSVGANLDARGKDGCTPLHVAARIGHLVLVQYLVSSGSDVSLTDQQGRTALDVARECKKANVDLFLDTVNEEAKPLAPRSLSVSSIAYSDFSELGGDSELASRLGLEWLRTERLRQQALNGGSSSPSSLGPLTSSPSSSMMTPSSSYLAAASPSLTPMSALQATRPISTSSLAVDGDSEGERKRQGSATAAEVPSRDSGLRD